MNLGATIRQGAQWLFAGSVANQVVQFAVGVLLARLLVPADFGMLVTVQIYTGLASFIASGGLGQALIRAKQATPRDFQVVFTVQLFIGILIYTVFFATAPLFAKWYDNPVYQDLMRVSAISFLLRPFLGMPSAWLTREMRFKQRVVLELIFAPVGYSIPIVLAWMGWGVWALVIGGLVGSVIHSLILFSIAPIRPAFRFDMKLAKELGLYSIKVSSNDLVSYLRSQTPNFFLGHLQGPHIVGLFNKADSLAKTPRLIAGSAYDPVFRSLAKTQDNLDQSRYIYFRTVTLLSVYMLPLFVGLAWLAHPFIAFVYGEKWLPAAEPLTILSAVGLLVCIGYPSGAVLAARDWLGREIFVHITQIVLFAGSCIIGIRWGLSGVAWGIVCSEAVSVFFIAFLVKQCLRSTFAQLANSLKPGLILNALLCIALIGFDLLIPHGFSERQPFSYIAVMSLGGAATYCAAFFLIPISAIANEVARWKKALRYGLAAG